MLLSDFEYDYLWKMIQEIVGNESRKIQKKPLRYGKSAAEVAAEAALISSLIWAHPMFKEKHYYLYFPDEKAEAKGYSIFPRQHS